MRPNNQNKRSRGRNSGNRNRQVGGNPLTRNYESNGPDVKVRGNAAHIVEKYVQLARDSQNASDSVAEQNYLQHAEHYLRIVSAATAQNLQRQEKQMAENQERQIAENSAKASAQNSTQAIETSKEVKPAETKPAKAEPVEAKPDDISKEPSSVTPKPRVRRPRRQPSVANDKAQVEQAKDLVKDKMPKTEADGLPAFLSGGEKPDAAQ